MEPDLARRIELLAARVTDADPEDASALLSAIAGLRTDLGALRAHVGSLRSELGAVRSGLDAETGRLSASLSATRAETTALLRRHDDLADRVGELAERLEELHGAFPALGRDLRELGDSLPARTGERVAAQVEHLRTDVRERLDDAIADLRRSLGSGLEQASAGSRAAESALGETRSVLEERLAALEDALDELAERLDSVGRDGVRTASEKLAALQEAQQETSGTVGELVETTHSALVDLGGAVDRSLGSLGSSLAAAVSETRESERRHLDAALAEVHRELESALTRSGEEVTGAVAEQLGFLRTLQESLEERLQSIRDVLGGGLAEARSELIDELTGSLRRLEEANRDTRSAVEEEVSALRVDLADALEEIRDRVSRQAQESADSVRAALAAQQEAFDETARQLRSDVLDELADVRAGMLTRLDAMAVDVERQGRVVDDLSQRAGFLEEAVNRTADAVARLDSGWQARTEEVVAQARAAGEAAVGEVRDALAGTTAALQDAARGLAGGTDRLTDAGRGLLGYLAERDRALEQDRETLLHQMLDDFAEGLSPKERRSLADRLGDVLDRRRDSRDAQRWRSEQQSPPPVPAPPDLSVYLDPIEGVASPEAPERAREEVPDGAALVAVRKAAPANRTATKKAAAKKTAAKKTATAGRTRKSTPAKKTAPKKATAKKAPAPADEWQPTDADRADLDGTGVEDSDTGTGAADPADRDFADTGSDETDGPIERVSAAARRRRASVSSMPQVPSPQTALDAATGTRPPADESAAAPEEPDQEPPSPA